MKIELTDEQIIQMAHAIGVCKKIDNYKPYLPTHIPCQDGTGYDNHLNDAPQCVIDEYATAVMSAGMKALDKTRAYYRDLADGRGASIAAS